MKQPFSLSLISVINHNFRFHELTSEISMQCSAVTDRCGLDTVSVFWNLFAAGADPGILERGFMFKGVGVRFADFMSFFLSHLIKTELFHFHRIITNMGQRGFKRAPCERGILP